MLKLDRWRFILSGALLLFALSVAGVVDVPTWESPQPEYHDVTLDTSEPLTAVGGAVTPTIARVLHPRELYWTWEDAWRRPLIRMVARFGGDRTYLIST